MMKNFEYLSFILLFVASLSRESKAVKISELNVPPKLNVDAADSVILDCVYEVDKSMENQLDIKWYFNNDPSPFYMWIPGYKPGVLPLEPFQSTIDLSDSHVDPKEAYKYNEHRAIKILRPNYRHSGLYTCKASTFLGEDSVSAPMIVYGLPERQYINVTVNHYFPNLLKIECQFLRVFPRPQIVLEWTSPQMSGSLDGGMGSYIFPSEKTEGALDVEIYYELTLEDGYDVNTTQIHFECSLEIPSVDEKVMIDFDFEYPKEEEEIKLEEEEIIIEEIVEESGSGLAEELSGDYEESSGEEGSSEMSSGESSGDSIKCESSGLCVTDANELVISEKPFSEEEFTSLAEKMDARYHGLDKSIQILQEETETNDYRDKEKDDESFISLEEKIEARYQDMENTIQILREETQPDVNGDKENEVEGFIRLAEKIEPRYQGIENSIQILHEETEADVNVDKENEVEGFISLSEEMEARYQGMDKSIQMLQEETEPDDNGDEETEVEDEIESPQANRDFLIHPGTQGPLKLRPLRRSSSSSGTLASNLFSNMSLIVLFLSL